MTFKLRRLRLDTTSTQFGAKTWGGWGSGLEQLLATQYLPFLQELRLSCRQLPTLSADFISQLHVAQVDFPYVVDIEHDYGDLWQLDATSTQVLTSFDTISCYLRPYFERSIRNTVYAHLRIRDAGELSTIVRRLPDLKALKFEISGLTMSTRNLDSLDKPEVADTLSHLRTRSIELFAAGSGNDDFVDPGFLRFLDSQASLTALPFYRGLELLYACACVDTCIGIISLVTYACHGSSRREVSARSNGR